MFFRKRREIDKLNSRCVDLARQLRDSNLENSQLKQIRKDTETNNSKILKTSHKRYKALEEIIKLAESNTYNNEKSIIRKIKELAQTAIEN